MVHKQLVIKNMSCHCCIRLVQRILNDIGVDVLRASLGELEIAYDKSKTSLNDIVATLQQEGFELLLDRETKLVEQIKNAVIDLIRYSTYNSMIRNSDYLVERFNLSYQHISRIFSKHERITLEKFIIQQKIDRAKELIVQGELTLSEIAFMMGYSSVQYLSNQFKSVTGISVTDYKKGSTAPGQTTGA